MELDARERVDQLIKYFWLNGYLTVSRKFGTYLPEPNPVGDYDVDAIGKYKKKYVIGITLQDDEIRSSNIKSKLDYLSTRSTRYSNKRVALFVGVSPEYYQQAKAIIESLGAEAYKNIKLIILENRIPTLEIKKNRSHIPNFS